MHEMMKSFQVTRGGIGAALILICTFAAMSTKTREASAESNAGWKKHVVYRGARTHTAVAADFTGDGLTDVICDSDGKTRLFVAPSWKELVIHEHPETKHHSHSEFFDVDGDGDVDYIGARYKPGLIIWLENPGDINGPWKSRVIDDRINGIHGLIKADVDGDGRMDLLANSAQPLPPYPESLAWFSKPDDSRLDEKWELHVFAVQDAPGLTHYLGVGDIDGDGRLDAATGAKGGPQAKSVGEWFAWWKADATSKGRWEKNLVSCLEPGATNIHPVEINGDGIMDLLASRGHGRGVLWFQGPDWSRREMIDEEIKEPHCLAAVDLDQDGDVDAATCAFGDQIVVWYENDGKGEFERHVIAEGQEAYDIRAVDMDQDGDLDLLIAGRDSKNVVWYENPLSLQR